MLSARPLKFARGSRALNPLGVDRIAESIVSDSLGEREAVIEALYAAAMDPSLWPAALHCVACFVAGRDDEAIAALAFAEGPDVSKGWILASTELRGERTYDVATDAHPLLQGQATAGGDAVASERFPARSPHEHAAVAHEIVGRDGSVHGLSRVLHQDGRLVAVAHVLRRREGPWWSDGATQRFASLTAHLGRALDMYVRLRRAREHAQVERVLLDRLDIAALALDADRRVTRSNLAADVLLARRDGLYVEGSTLRCDTARAEESLQGALSTVHAGDGLGAIETSLVLVPRLSGRRPLLLFISPIPSPDDGSRALGATVLVRDADVVRPELEGLIARLFGLTPSEVHIAVRVALGDPPNDVAERLGLSVDTVRSHLKRVFFKTATRGQSDLVRLVFGEVPPVNP